MAESKLVVIPADPLYKYCDKGEIKARYWNPCQTFSEVHILSLAPCEVPAKSVQVLVGDARLHIHAIGTPSMWTLPFYFAKVRRLIERIGPNVIRAHGPWHTGSLAVPAGRSLGIPVLVSLHGDRDAQRRHEPSLLLQMVRPLEEYTLRRATAIICVSDYLHQYARRHGARRTYTVYNKVYADIFAPAQGRRVEGPLRVLSVMRLDRAKYPECLIEAIAPLGVHLTLIGQGELGGVLRRQVERLGLVDRVEFVRQIPHHEIHEYYRRADVFAMATHHEGFCIPVLEAMAAGLPVVASATGPIPEVLGGTGWLVDKKPTAFTDALRQLARDPARRAAMGMAARRRALVVDGRRQEEREAHLYQTTIAGDRAALEGLLSSADRFVNKARSGAGDI